MFVKRQKQAAQIKIIDNLKNLEIIYTYIYEASTYSCDFELRGCSSVKCIKHGVILKMLTKKKL